MNNFFEIKSREKYRSELVSKWGEGHWLVKQFDNHCAENDEIISGKKSRPTPRALDGGQAAAQSGQVDMPAASNA